MAKGKRTTKNKSKRIIKVQNQEQIIVPSNEVVKQKGQIELENLESIYEKEVGDESTGTRLQPNINFLGRVLSSLERSNAMQLVAEVEASSSSGVPSQSSSSSSSLSSTTSAVTVDACFAGKRREGIALIERIASIYGIKVKIIDNEESPSMIDNKKKIDCRAIIEEAQLIQKVPKNNLDSITTTMNDIQMKKKVDCRTLINMNKEVKVPLKQQISNQTQMNNNLSGIENKRRKTTENTSSGLSRLFSKSVQKLTLPTPSTNHEDTDSSSFSSSSVNIVLSSLKNKNEEEKDSASTTSTSAMTPSAEPSCPDQSKPPTSTTKSTISDLIQMVKDKNNIKTNNNNKHETIQSRNNVTNKRPLTLNSQQNLKVPSQKHITHSVTNSSSSSTPPPSSSTTMATTQLAERSKKPAVRSLMLLRAIQDATTK